MHRPTGAGTHVRTGTRCLRPGRSSRLRGAPGAGGQILVLFVFSLLAIMAMSALLFDAAQALVVRRQLQNAGDAAALAAANVIQSGSTRGCSLAAGSPPGAPRTEVVAAATAAVAAQLPGTPASAVRVSCPDGWHNYAVEVDIDGHSPGYFGGALGLNGFAVGSTSQAVNGQVTSLRYSIVELDPSNPSWPNGRRGCPSVLVSGGPTIVLDGSMQVDSACAAANGGALATNGNAASLSFNNGALIRIVGGFVPGALSISPAPLTGVDPIRDPLAGLPTMPATLPVRASSRQVFGSGNVVLEPGVYRGGIQLKNSVKAFLHPGIYVMQGGGFDVGAQNGVYSVGAGVTTTDDAHWASDCSTAACGVLLYNTGTSSSLGQITVGAGATVRIRPYQPWADGTGANMSEYANLLLWQDGSPAPTGSYAQPTVALNGGGSVDISGTVYAPSAAVTMGGGSGGSGGSATDLTLQFISWDLQFQGNSSFHFFYQNERFAKPTDYGLIR